MNGKPVRLSKGFGLVEVLLAMAISGIVLAGMTASVKMLMDVSRKDGAALTDTRGLDSAGSWFARDFAAAQAPLPPDTTLSPGGSTLTLVQSVQSPSDRSVVYRIDTAGNLSRTQGAKQTVLATNVTSVGYLPGLPSTVQITAASGGATVTRTYDILSRVR